MKKTLITLITGACVALPTIAEKLVLTYGTTVTVYDDNGKRIGTRKLNAGTEIATVAKKISKAEKVKMAISDEDPEQWQDKKGKKSACVFIGQIKLVERDMWPKEFGKPGRYKENFLVSFVALHKSKDCDEISKTLFMCIPSRRTDTGKELFDLVKDNDSHNVLVKINVGKDTQYKNTYTIEAFEKINAE